MWFKRTILTMGLAASVVLTEEPIHPLTKREPIPAMNLASPRIYPSPHPTQQWTWKPPPGVETGFLSGRPLGGDQTFPPKPLKPGAYRTTPFACIVIVPDNHLDEPIAALPSQNVCAMPTLKPELHFIPLEPK